MNMDYSDDESASSLEASAVAYPEVQQQNAKTLRLPNDDEDEYSSYDEDTSMDMEVNGGDQASTRIPNGGTANPFGAQFAPGGAQARGKVLRLQPGSSDEDDDDQSDTAEAVVIPEADIEEPASSSIITAAAKDEEFGDDESSGDELLITHKSNKKKGKGTSSSKKIPNGGGEEEVEVAAAVVVDGNASDASGEVVAVAEVLPKKVRKKPGPKKGWKKKLAAANAAKSVLNDGKKGNGSSSHKRRKKASGGSDSDCGDEVHTVSASVSRDRLEAAQAARDVFISSVQHTPFKFSESHTVRNFGRIKIEDDSSNPLFSSATSLYPVGYSCDRYEFSPIHGRIIKLRCDILDGDKVKMPVSTEKEKSRKGPIFRIAWGMGIDEIDDGRPFPFDLYSAAAPLGNEVDTVAVPLGLDSMNIVPQPDMRVKVLFENDTWYRGTISKVSLKKEDSDTSEKKKRGGKAKKGKKGSFIVSIRYDDGMKEDVSYPDPDVVLVAPGSETIGDESILDVTSVKGNPVTSVYGRTPLEAWANALIRLGLIDEIMYEKALKSISNARIEGINEVKDRMEAIRRQRQEARARQLQKQKDPLGSQSSPQPHGKSTGERDSFDEEKLSSLEDEMEPPSAKEKKLRMRARRLLEAYEKRLEDSKRVAISLADARITAQGRFLSNPFYDDEVNQTHQKNWISAVIKKEKSKMGSTGNKRKIVTPTDILDRNATFYNADISRVLEGLPGAEYCGDYIFHDLRGNNGASQNSWMHEAKVRKEKENQQKKKRARENEAKASIEREKQRKRKAREDERENKKKQRLEELDQQKQVRKEERLSRLTTQIEDRLFKESCFQRERVVLLASKLVGKEISRRRKTSEVVAAYTIERSPSPEQDTHESSFELPPLGKKYDADVVRLHDFLMTYKGFFEDQKVLRSIPSVGELQRAVDTFSPSATATDNKNDDLNLLNEVAIALCKPITASLIKTLSSALTSGLQGKNEDEKGEKEISSDDPDEFHVNSFSWKEVFRLFLLSDILSELGLTKIEQTHVLRGYRSGGHPNSKEAKRIRRGEDSALVLRRQGMVEDAAVIAEGSGQGKRQKGFTIVVPTPCKSSVGASDWLYYLYNIKALPSNAATGMKSNLRKARSILKSSTSPNAKESDLEKLDQNIALLDQIGSTFTSSSETMNVCKKVRRTILKMLDRASGELYSTDKSSDFVYRELDMGSNGKSRRQLTGLQVTSKDNRLRSGMLEDLHLKDVDYKKMIQEKEEYMANAIKFKEDQERQQKRAAGEEVEEDDEEDDEDEDDDDEIREEKKDTPEDVTTGHAKEDDIAGRIGKKTDYDDFCADDPKAPELIRRCLAVLRNLCMSSPAETFLYPVDPQTNLKYYESVMKPMSLYDVGKFLQKAIDQIQGMDNTNIEFVESIVAEFARRVRTIGKNPICFSPVGGPLISTAEEMLRIFERLFFDWILAPKNLLPSLEMLDDEKCVEFHESDEESMVLLCDGCEGKYNMSRLDPPLHSVPKGDWYCPRCRAGHCWATVDPRIGKTLTKPLSTDSKQYVKGKIKECRVSIKGDGNKKTLSYIIRYEHGVEELWSLHQVDTVLNESSKVVDQISCLEAVIESPGYGCGVHSRFPVEILPALVNPQVSDSAAQKFIASSSFRSTILSCATLLISDTDGISSSEWLQLLNLMVMKCMSSDPIQEYASKLEGDSFAKLSERKSAEVSKIKSIQDILPKVTDDEAEEKTCPSIPPGIPSEVGGAVHDQESEKAMEMKRQKGALVRAMKNRQKKREDAFMASIIRKQMKPAIASLEEDNITRVINNALTSHDDGITFASVRCRSLTCDLCGLSDVALGSPLLRYPDEKEWAERAGSTITNRNSFLIAEMPECATTGVDTEMNLQNDNGNKIAESKFVLVSIKIGNEVVLGEDTESKFIDQDISSCGLLPRNNTGFQMELKARANGGLPLITGSLSVHECCAQAANKARKEKMIQTAKKQISLNMELTHGNKCGRTTSIGFDVKGRSYWRFDSNPGSLFVFVKVPNTSGNFLCFSSSETIASVIMYLGQQRIASDIRRLFPNAVTCLQTGKWSTLLQQRAFKREISTECSEELESDGKKTEEEDSAQKHYSPGDEILVESSTKKILWDANIVAVAKSAEDGPIVGYRVHYKDWSSRFDEWVECTRIFELNDENLQKQHHYATQLAKEPSSLPPSIKGLVAASYLSTANRARDALYMPNFERVLKQPSFSAEDDAITELKVAVLLVEAALPSGSVKTSDNGIWKPETASHWRSMVVKSTTPGDLMGCLVLLETAISKDWLLPNAEHLVSCLPRSWKSINEATVSSIALRLWTLDQGIKYALVKGEDGNWDTIEPADSFSGDEYDE